MAARVQPPSPGLSILAVLALSLPAAGAPQPAGPPRTAWVQDFRAAVSADPSSGPVGRLRTRSRAGKALEAAAQLSADLAKELGAAGLPAHRLAPEAPLPREGWLVRGVFYALGPQGSLVERTLGQTSKESPNTEVTVTIADLSGDPSAPLFVLGSAEALRGQGMPVGWNPYVIAAKFVVGKAGSAADLEKLAKEIAQEVLAHRDEMAAHAGTRPAP